MSSGEESRIAGRLVVFTRYPEPGRAKTRLIPTLGQAGAAELHARMTEHTLEAVGPRAAQLGIELEVRFAGGDGALMAAWLGESRTVTPQGPGSLGERMTRAVAEALHAPDGAPPAVVVIGCDIPQLDGEVVERAFAALTEQDVVFGPALDGGYYLVGIASRLADSSWPRLFDGVDWGTDRVLEQSLERAELEGLQVAQLEPLADVDDAADLPLWERIRGERRNS